MLISFFIYIGKRHKIFFSVYDKITKVKIKNITLDTATHLCLILMALRVE